jgi:hypothetical protein
MVNDEGVGVGRGKKARQASVVGKGNEVLATLAIYDHEWVVRVSFHVFLRLCWTLSLSTSLQISHFRDGYRDKERCRS